MPAACKYDKNLWDGRILYSLAKHYGFSLDTPFEKLPDEIVDILLYGTKGKRFPIEVPPGATIGTQHQGRITSWGGVVNRIERRYRRYRKEGRSTHWMEEWLKRVMVEHTCPDCGGKRLKCQRFLVTLGGLTIHALGEIPLEDLVEFMDQVPIPVERWEAGSQVVAEIVRRKHLADIQKLLDSLNRLVDAGHTVVVIEHHLDMIKTADHVIDLGPGGGHRGGTVIASGTPEEIARTPGSHTGRYLAGFLQHL